MSEKRRRHWWNKNKNKEIDRSWAKNHQRLSRKKKKKGRDKIRKRKNIPFKNEKKTYFLK